MKQFAQLYAELDATTSNNAKLAAMQRYFAEADPADAAWAVYFLSGGKPKQLVPVKILRLLALQMSGLPDWLFEESYHAVGDLAETIALLLPETEHSSEEGLAVWVEQKLMPLYKQPVEVVMAELDRLWRRLDRQSQYVSIKLITGAFRVGVSKLSVTRALAAVSGVDSKRIAQRLVGYTDLSGRPSPAAFRALIAPESEHEQTTRSDGQPYPFFLAHQVQIALEDFGKHLGPVEAWQIEWKWDGIRSQVVKRGSQLWVWSRGEDLVTERFPELHGLLALPNGTVIDGEIVVWKDGKVQPFALLQQRIGRKTLSAKILESAPVIVLAYDLLEWQGEDWRARPQEERRRQLETLVHELRHPALQLSPTLQADSWEALAEQREQSRSRGVEGMMLKHKSAHYGVGRTKDVGVWWKWKIDPYSVDAVLIYAQPGHGRRASLYTDYTFAVWDGPPSDPERKLVPFAKAYSGLTDEEIRQVDALVRRTTVEKFGPVRSVEPMQVFELGFEGIARSSRHKSGIAVRFPRILRWRRDKPAAEADTLAILEEFLGGA